MNRKITALFLCLALVLPLSLTGCGVRAKASNLMEGVLAQGPGEDVEMTEEAAASVADFAVRLLQRDMGEGSVLLSPLSVLCALAMTANGAEGGTLAQLEEVFGLSVPELNQFLSSYRSALSSPGENKLHFANSIWLKEGLAVEAAIPKFTGAHSTELSEPLRAMGITDAFDRAAADFSGIGSYGNQRLVISQFLHKTYLEVDETGTKAGAATAVELAPTSSPIESEETRRVYLNRPFVYLVIDCQTKLPLFLGTVMELEE